MKNMPQKLALILVVTGLCVLALVTKDLRLGKDLRGGVSLIYRVDVAPEDPDPQATLGQIIEVLKDRVNPSGVFDISFEPMGRDRIAITMPLPNEEVRALKDAFDESLEAMLAESEIDPAALDESLRTGDAVAQFGGPEGTARHDLVQRLQDAYDARNEARAALETAGAADGDQLTPEERRFALANARYREAYEETLATSLGEPRVRRALTQPTAPEDTGQLDEDGEPIYGPSKREAAIQSLRDEFPWLSDRLDEVIADWEAFQDVRTGFDDPEDLKRLLRGAGVLEFRIAVEASQPEGVDVENLREQLAEVGPGNTDSPVAAWFPINQLKQWYQDAEQLAALEADPVNYFASFRDLIADTYEGEFYLLLYDTPERSIVRSEDRPWAIRSASRTVDQLGRPAVGFGLDAAGAGQMGRLTGANRNRPMAIVLDGEVYSAPNINSQITSDGIIQGEFTTEEIDYLIRVLAAGSLSAKLSEEPISVSILGPSIGADNLERGREAFIISIIAVAAIMLVYYLTAGIVAVIALAINGLLIFGILMGIDGTFTLPGLAGIVLTIGMAVDANVLIYERIREEIFAGELDLKGSIRQGYAKALSTIVDANVTNLIVCFVLFRTATAEVKGFALTLTIGIAATLFTALFVTRQVYYFYTDVFRARKLAMLPVIVPSIHRALEPNINWVGLRKVYWTVSTLAVAGSLVLVFSRGADMLDTEFRGGVAMNMVTRTVDADDDGQPDVNEDGELVRLKLPHVVGDDSVEARIHAIGEAWAARIEESGGGDAAGADDESALKRAIYPQFAKADVLTVGSTETDADGNVVASEFQIKVAVPEGLDDDTVITDLVVSAVVEAFGDQLDVTPPVTFAGAGGDGWRDHARPVVADELGASIGRPDATQRVAPFIGGAVLVLEELDPPVTPAEVLDRVRRMRDQPDFQDLSGRRTEAIGLDPVDPADSSQGYRTVALLVKDPAMRLDRERLDLLSADPVWQERVAAPEWELASQALEQPASLEQVSSFSSAVAQTLKAQATVAVILTLLGILVYIWVRFGSIRYSLAAIVALVHDVTIALGLLALSTVIAGTGIANLLLIEPFRINLGVVAALLTIIGYSLNDTIVILDRIRENRGKLPVPTSATVNLSINQTVSRTLLTSVTTLVAVLIMYFEGGSGIRSFTYCLLAGLLVGTYSSVAIAAPLVFSNKQQKPATTRGEMTPPEGEPAPA